MKSFKQYLTEMESAEAAPAEENILTKTNNNVNKIIPPPWQPPPDPNNHRQEWGEQWERTHPFPKQNEGESDEDYEKRVDRWFTQREIHLRKMHRLFMFSKGLSPHGEYKDPRWYYDEPPERPLTDEELKQQEAWEFLRDLGIPGPWNNIWGDNPII